MQVPSKDWRLHDFVKSRERGACWRRVAQVKFSIEERMAARQQIVCVQCDKPEESCTCEKYCTICKGQTSVRLCADGLYYCPDCREACDVALANNR